MWELVIAAASPLAVAAGFLYTQRRTDRREVAKWRNEQLLKAVSELLRLSTLRQSELNDAYDDYVYNRDSGRRGGKSSETVWQIELLVEQIRLLDRRCVVAAETIYEGHKLAQVRWATEFQGQMVPPDDEYVALMVKDLANLHAALVDAFQAVTGVVELSGGGPKRPWPKLLGASQWRLACRRSRPRLGG